MKKMMMVLLTLVTILSLTICAVAEEYEVAATITTTSEDEANALYAPEIPAGTLSADVFGFDAGQMYAVYSAPDVKSIRGAAGKAKVSTNDWVQVFGREGSWLMVQYDVKDSFYRIGYISDKAIPVGMTVSLANGTGSVNVEIRGREISEIWKNGFVHCEYLKAQDDYTSLAGYLARQAAAAPDQKKWHPTRNLEKPVIESEKIVENPKELHTPPGADVQEFGEYDKDTGTHYVRYIRRPRKKVFVDGS